MSLTTPEASEKERTGIEEEVSLIDSPTPPTNRLRTRIMATGYQYTQLKGHSEMVLDEDDEKYRRSQSRTVCLVLIIFTLLLVVMGLLIVLVVMKDDSDSNRTAGLTANKDVCMTPGCIATSADVLKDMDPDVDPCSDMYNYACGGWMADHSLPPGYGRWNKFSELNVKNGDFLRTLFNEQSIRFKGQNSTAISKLKSYYRTCMDEEAIEARGTTGIQKVINDFERWTVTSEGNTTWNEDVWDFQDALIKNHLAGGDTFFSIGIVIDVKDTSKRVIKFFQAGLTLSSHLSYSNNRSQELKHAYLDFASNIGVLLGGEEKNVRTKMEQVYNLEKELAKIFIPLEELSDPHSTYNEMSIRELQNATGSWVDVGQYLTGIFGGRSFLSDDTVNVATPAYFKKLGRIVEKTDKEVLANYMMWMLIQSMTSFLPESFTKAALPLTKAETGVVTLPERWQKCFALTNSAIGFASSALFVDNKFTSASKEQVISALHKVIREFVKNLDSVTWLDYSTRERLKEKANLISYKVGYPDWIMNPKALDDYYAKLIVKEGEFLENWLQVVNFSTEFILSKYGTPPDKSEWNAYPHTVNAFYDVESNEVLVPAGILQPPFYSPDFPKPFLYSIVGMIVGHEMTHGFDNTGRMFDKNGNLGDQWTDATSSQFDQKADCMVEQYGNYTLNGNHLNGRLTLNENIADNGGLIMAYRAFKDDIKTESKQLPGLKLNDDQMFFLGFSQIWCIISTDEMKIHSTETDSHSYGELRVKGVLSNFPEFATAFNCSKSSPMVSSKLCHVW